MGVPEFGAVVDEPGQAVVDVWAAAARTGGDPAGGLARGGWSRAWLVQGQPPPEGCDGHSHPLVVAEVALALEFLVQDLRAVLSLVPALLQVVEVGVQGGGLAGRAAHYFLPGAGLGVLAYGSAVQVEFPGHGTVAPAGAGQGVHGLEQPSGMPPGPGVRRGVLGSLPDRSHGSGAVLRAGSRGGRRRCPGRGGRGPARGHWWAVGEVPAEQVLFPRPPVRTTHATCHRTSLSSDYSVSAGAGLLPWMSAWQLPQTTRVLRCRAAMRSAHGGRSPGHPRSASLAT